jgi:hypothetical protein
MRRQIVAGNTFCSMTDDINSQQPDSSIHRLRVVTGKIPCIHNTTTAEEDERKQIMRHRSNMFLTSLFLTAILCSTAGTVIAQEQLPLSNLGEFKLKIGGVQFTGSMSREDLLRDTRTTLSPAKEHTLAIATLQGTVPRACSITLRSNSLTAVVESEAVGKNGKKSRKKDTVNSVAITAQSDFSGHDLPPSLDKSIVGTYYFHKTGPVTLKVLFTVPENTVSIRVDSAAGTIKVPKQNPSK